VPHKIAPVRQDATKHVPVPGKCANSPGGDPKRRCVTAGCGTRKFDESPVGDEWPIPHLRGDVKPPAFVPSRLAPCARSDSKQRGLVS
jgi:hypothetical protein